MKPSASKAPSRDNSLGDGFDRAALMGLTEQALALAERLPDLILRAQAVVSALIFGWHGRKRPGTGEMFWQFRTFTNGEPAARVDWRRSARDDHLYVRETEWEAAQTIWLWPDVSPSMNFASDLAPIGKRDRGIVLALALGDIFVRGGERVGLLGNGGPVSDNGAGERLAMRLLRAYGREPGTLELPSLDALKRDSIVILCSDFLDPPEHLEPWLRQIANKCTRVHLIQVLDPSEETFPYRGRTEFIDPETGERIDFQQAGSVRDGYIAALETRRARLRALCRRFGWSFLLHHTDHPASQPLMALLGRLTDSGLVGGRT